MRIHVFPELLGSDYALISETPDEARYLRQYYETINQHLDSKLRVVQPEGWWLLFFDASWGDDFSTCPSSLNFCLFSCTKGLDRFRDDFLVPFEKKYILTR